MKTRLFVGLISFWLIMIMFSNIFVNELDSDLVYGSVSDLKPDYVQGGYREFMTDLFDSIEDIPIIGTFTPLMSIMSFTYPQDFVPTWLIIILDSTLVFTVYIIYSLIRGSG